MVEPIHLKLICSSKWGSSSPMFRGEHQKYFELPPTKISHQVSLLKFEHSSHAPLVDCHGHATFRPEGFQNPASRRSGYVPSRPPGKNCEANCYCDAAGHRPAGGGEMPWAERQPHAEISQTSHQDGQINTAITNCQTLDCLPNQLERSIKSHHETGIFTYMNGLKSMVNVGQNTSPIEHLE